MPAYETVYIVAPNTPEQTITEFEERLKGIAQKHQGKIVESKSLGQKPFAFPLKKAKEGIYRHIQFEGAGSLIPEWEQSLKYNEKVLRFITTRLNNQESST